MNEKIDFLAYAEKRQGLPPRSIIQNTISCVLGDRTLLAASDSFRVVEYGFNHGNDAKFIINALIAEVGLAGWEYWGFDHEDYFFTKGLREYCDSRIQRNVHLVPCLFENIAYSNQEIPRNVNMVYSSKSLSLCDKEKFPALMRAVLDSITPGGYFVGTMHLNSHDQSHFWNVDDYMDMFFDPAAKEPPLFSGFDSQFEVDAERQTFAVFAKKTMRMKAARSDTLLVERNGGRYVEASHE